MISILLPTRNRPDNLMRLFESLLDTTDDIKGIEMCFLIDSDDVVSIKSICEIDKKIKTTTFQIEVSPEIRNSQSMMYNELYKIATGPIYMFCADDVVFRTKSWDTEVKKVFGLYTDGIVLVYGPDGFQFGPVPVCTHGFIHQNWVKTVGTFFPPYFNIAYNDTWITEVAEKLGRRVYLNNVYFEHMHPAAGKSNWDGVYYGKVESPGGEQNIYNMFLPEREEWVRKLKIFIENNDK